jgi:hypothetical protein
MHVAISKFSGNEIMMSEGTKSQIKFRTLKGLNMLSQSIEIIQKTCYREHRISKSQKTKLFIACLPRVSLEEPSGASQVTASVSQP